MIKTILASLTGFSADRTVLDAAIAAARIDGAHVRCLHTRIDPLEAAGMYQSIALNHPGTLQQISQEIAAEERDRSTRARAEFEDACKRHGLKILEAPAQHSGPSMSWKEVETVFNETLHQARFHDLVVMGRDTELSDERIKSVLMQAGRPLLLAPPKPVTAIGRRIAVAWKEGPEVARALTAAMPLLAHAEQVAILCVSTNKDGDGRASAEHLAGQLRWHGVQTELHMNHEDAGSTAEKLRKMAYHCDADLLVMGAYGHSRVREFFFGGVTRGMLGDCALPVLMLH